MIVYVDFILTLFWILMLWYKKSVLLQNEVEIDVKIVASCSHQNKV